MMPYTEAQKKATAKYKASKYKRVPLDMPTPEYERIKAHTEARHETVNGFIRRAVSEAIERDTQTEAKQK